MSEFCRSVNLRFNELIIISHLIADGVEDDGKDRAAANILRGLESGGSTYLKVLT